MINMNLIDCSLPESSIWWICTTSGHITLWMANASLYFFCFAGVFLSIRSPGFNWWYPVIHVGNNTVVNNFCKYNPLMTLCTSNSSSVTRNKPYTISAMLNTRNSNNGESIEHSDFYKKIGGFVLRNTNKEHENKVEGLKTPHSLGQETTQRTLRDIVNIVIYHTSTDITRFCCAPLSKQVMKVQLTYIKATQKERWGRVNSIHYYYKSREIKWHYFIVNQLACRLTLMYRTKGDNLT